MLRGVAVWVAMSSESVPLRRSPTRPRERFSLSVAQFQLHCTALLLPVLWRSLPRVSFCLKFIRLNCLQVCVVCERIAPGGIDDVARVSLGKGLDMPGTTSRPNVLHLATCSGQKACFKHVIRFVSRMIHTSCDVTAEITSELCDIAKVANLPANASH